MEERINNLGNEYTRYFISIIRSKVSPKKELRSSLYSLGQEVGKHIFGKWCLEESKMVAPANNVFNGVIFSNNLSVIISTRNDYDHFAKGCRQVVKNSLSGFMDFGDIRGEAVYTSPLRAISLPEIPENSKIFNLIILKSVLASGCTAVSLAKRSLEVYQPTNLIIASVFYSVNGLNEILRTLPPAKICIFGEPDEVDSSGMLIPGMGYLDSRVSKKPR